MTTAIAQPLETKRGTEARKLRVSLHVSKLELSELSGVSLTDINLFEHNWPVALDCRRRIFKELWAIKNKK